MEIKERVYSREPHNRYLKLLLKRIDETWYVDLNESFYKDKLPDVHPIIYTESDFKTSKIDKRKSFDNKKKRYRECLESLENHKEFPNLKIQNNIIEGLVFLDDSGGRGNLEVFYQIFNCISNVFVIPAEAKIYDKWLPSGIYYIKGLIEKNNRFGPYSTQDILVIHEAKNLETFDSRIRNIPRTKYQKNYDISSLKCKTFNFKTKCKDILGYIKYRLKIIAGVLIISFFIALAFLNLIFPFFQFYLQ